MLHLEGLEHLRILLFQLLSSSVTIGLSFMHASSIVVIDSLLGEYSGRTLKLGPQASRNSCLGEGGAG